jgi:hypothetical protein
LGEGVTNIAFTPLSEPLPYRGEESEESSSETSVVDAGPRGLSGMVTSPIPVFRGIEKK